jgi:hypothetical protein
MSRDEPLWFRIAVLTPPGATYKFFLVLGTFNPDNSCPPVPISASRFFLLLLSKHKLVLEQRRSDLHMPSFIQTQQCFFKRGNVRKNNELREESFPSLPYTDHRQSVALSLDGRGRMDVVRRLAPCTRNLNFFFGPIAEPPTPTATPSTMACAISLLTFIPVQRVE